MKKAKMYIFIVLSLIFSLDKVNAECDNKSQLEINAASSNVTMNYTLETLVVDTDGNIHPEIASEDVELSELGKYSLIDKASINVNNVSDKVYVVFYSNDDGINKEYHYQDLKNGSFTYEVPELDTIRNYTLTIYSDVSNCGNQELRTIDVTTPMYNSLSEQVVCNGNDAYYCQRYITTPINIDELDLKDNIKNTDKDSNLDNENNNQNFILFTIGIIAVIMIIIAIIIMVFENKRKNNNIKKNRG